MFGWASYGLVLHGSALVGRGMELEIVDRTFSRVFLRVFGRVRCGRFGHGKAQLSVAWNWEQSIGYWQQYHFECYGMLRRGMARSGQAGTGKGCLQREVI